MPWHLGSGCWGLVLTVAGDVCSFNGDDSERAVILTVRGSGTSQCGAHADPGVGPAGDKFRAIRLRWALQYRVLSLRVGCVLPVMGSPWVPQL